MDKSKVFDKDAALAQLGGDEEIFIELVNVFLESETEIVQKITSAIACADCANCKLYAHSMKSAARTIGGFIVGDIFASMEQLADENDIRAAAALFASVTSSLDELNEALANYLTSKAA